MPLRRNIPARKAGGRISRQPGQVRKEAAATSFDTGRFSLPPLKKWQASPPSLGDFSPPLLGDGWICAPILNGGPVREKKALCATEINAHNAIMTDPGDDSLKDTAAYQVLARKYRPQNFDDLIGHKAMIKTLRNAFTSGRIAHAFVLTGVRGVGKTTTARILARALNYVGADGDDQGPQIDMPAEGLHCRAIAESRHPDILEMDAASRTGVNDIRELIEGVRYAPVEARYKVYIIDEVHMLSTQAFNALLKTLEEPPAHVKFIFATTEIRKLPVTVLSRCQRFDLRRIEPDELTAHLKTIVERENASVEDEGLAMITRAAEGSVRDALSILDQALVQQSVSDNQSTSADEVRAMLGLADRSQIWDLLAALFEGDVKTALSLFREQFNAGADPAVVLRDLLELVHLLTRVKAAGPEAASHGAAGEADAVRAMDLATNLPMNGLTRAWSLLMKGLTETQTAPDPSAAGEMALIRLAYAADLPTPDEALRALTKNGAGESQSTAQNARQRTRDVKPARAQSAISDTPSDLRQKDRVVEEPSGYTPAQAAINMDVVPLVDPHQEPPQSVVQTFKDVVNLAAKQRDAKLRTELESYVHIVSFAPGRIEMRLEARAPTDLSGRLTRALKEWTGEKWIITVNSNKEGAATLRDARTAEVMAHPLVQKTLETFPDAQVRSIRDAEFVPIPEIDDDTEDSEA